MNKFYKLLSPKLQAKLVNSVLYEEVKKFRYFFNDTLDNYSAPRQLIVEVLKQLETSLFHSGDVIIRYESIVEDMVLISQGSCVLYGFYKEQGGETVKVRLTKLIEKSWFGDFNIILDIPSSF